MRNIIIEANLFKTVKDREWSEASLRTLVAALTQINVYYLESHPNTPSLYDVGVKYKREPGVEHWLAIPVLYKVKFGDCEDLATALAAEYIVKGINARAELIRQQRGNFFQYHVITMLPDGSIEDPSAKLGMK